MDETDRQRLEDDVHDACRRGDFMAAATVALRGYGPEIFGFLVAVHGQRGEASEVFSGVAEAIWRGLPSFGWESTLRTWAYAVARNASRTSRRDARRGARRAARVGASALEQVAQAVRTDTLAYLRTERRTRLQALRDALDPDDRMLLILRVDRGLGWNELARVLRGGEGPPEDAVLAGEAARLRKRFQRVKERLREMARREGLID